MAKVIKVLVFFVSLSFPFFCLAGKNATDREYVISVGANELKVMSYNVQNLFDALHDGDKQDYEFLPKDHYAKSKCPKNKASCLELDWTEEKIDLKLEQTRKVISAQGELPDILVLVEVENERIVKRLANHLGYDDFEMTNSPDNRGIDVAVLYRSEKLEFMNYEERVVKEALYPTRNISHIVFQLSEELGGGLLAVFPNHWPAPSNPTKSRLIVAETLREYVNEIRQDYSAKGENFNYILTGDFNTVEDDKPNPIDTILLDGKWDADLVDVRSFAKRKGNTMISKMPQATYYYETENVWNELDRFFVNPELADGRGLDVDAQSYRIHAPEFLTKENKNSEPAPFRYNHSTTSVRYLGYSDHFGVVVKLAYQ